jgi:hypothetical protein
MIWVYDARISQSTQIMKQGPSPDGALPLRGQEYTHMAQL